MEEQKKEGRRNTVKTVFSESAIRILESIVHWYYEETDHDALMPQLMKMFAAYIKHTPDDVHITEKPEYLAEGLMTNIIRLNYEIKQMSEEERV